MSLADAVRIKNLETDVTEIERRLAALEADPTAVEILERVERLEGRYDTIRLEEPEPKRGPGRPRKGA